MQAREALVERNVSPCDLVASLEAARRTSPERLAEATRALAGAEARLLPITSPGYPARLARISDAPPLLAVRGDVSLLDRPCVAIVGARAPSAYGLDAARRLAGDLAVEGVCVISGLARGIDAAAHRAALAAGGTSIAVLGCGPDRVYPAAHRGLARELCARGAVVSELPPGTPALPAHFPLRNRLISALSRAVVVVEARVRSGSLVTARHALDQGVEVLAVPGPIDVPTSEGPNRLLLDGARPALTAEVVLAEAGIEPSALALRDPPRDGPAHAAPAGADLASDPVAERVIAALRHAPSTRDELGASLGLAAASLAPVLLELELSGRLREDRDGRLRLSRAGGAPAGAPRL